MKKLTFKGFPDHPKGDTYRGPTGEWKKGDTKDVDDKEAERLAKDFPDVFVAPKA
jgi:hypothetical protein